MEKALKIDPKNQDAHFLLAGLHVGLNQLREATEEYERILATIDGDAQRVYTLQGSWGMRISELAMLEWSDIDYVGGWVHIRNKVTHDGIH